jgi:Na+-translocating ferredoxin:NAD+ oxidoreductase RnfC subunit
VTASIAEAVEKAGVVGAGGGGFPTHVKATASAEVLLVNGAECEPLLRSDTELLLDHAERVVRGAELMRDSVGAGRAVVALKKKNEAAVDAVERALPAGGVELTLLENVYPAGDEFLLVYDTTGRVVPEGGIPPDVGVVVSNVTTLSQVADAVEGRPVTSRLVTVQGEVTEPATFRVPVGTPIGEVVALTGPPTAADTVVLAGGPMMGRVVEALSEPTTKTDAGLIVLPADHRMVTTRTATDAYVLRIARAACCQCLACTELCPRFLLGHELMPHRTVRAVQYDTLEEDHDHVTSAFLCCECGMCELFACPLEIQPRRILAALKAELARRGIENPHRRTGLTAVGVRDYRQIPSARLVQRLGLSQYDGPAPFDPRKVEPVRVVLRLQQHTGAPARPVVDEGQRVLEGDLVGEIPDGSLGARVHASIDGTVESVSESEVAIVLNQPQAGGATARRGRGGDQSS